MIENVLKEKYGDAILGLDIYENTNSLKLARIIIKPEYKNMGIGTKIMQDIISYADKNKQIITLTPSNDFGGNKNRLIQFYKRFGFKHNKGHYKSFEFMDTMIRYPNLNESTKTLIKSLLKERLMTKNEPDIREIANFTNFTKEFLDINDDIKIELAFERIPELTTTAFYSPSGRLVVYAKNRALVDIMRSIAHELVHHKQNLDGRLKDLTKDGADGSEIENEANSLAGLIIRRYGKINPKIYE